MHVHATQIFGTIGPWSRNFHDADYLMHTRSRISMTAAINQLERGGGRYARCTMCIGAGHGAAMAGRVPAGS
jgi:hypothetical protein